MAEYSKIEYKCSYCGSVVSRLKNSGRPDPGECDRKPRTKDGKKKPHTWVINRKY